MRLIDADKIVYSWTIDADGTEHDGITLQSIIDKVPTINAIPIPDNATNGDMIKAIYPNSYVLNKTYAFEGDYMTIVLVEGMANITVSVD